MCYKGQGSAQALPLIVTGLYNGGAQKYGRSEGGMRECGGPVSNGYETQWRQAPNITS